MTRYIATFIIAITSVVAINAQNYIVVCFSRSGNTREIGKEIARQTDSDFVEVMPAIPYPSDYNSTLSRAQEEIAAIAKGEYPEINTVVNNLSSYDAVFICTPLWYGGMSTPMQSFLHKYSEEMRNMPVAMAVTSSSTGISGVDADLSELCPDSYRIGASLWVRASQVGNADALVENWLKTLTLPDGTSSIHNIQIDEQSESANSAIYDLNGRRLYQKPVQGIYIQNGKKYIAN